MSTLRFVRRKSLKTYFLLFAVFLVLLVTQPLVAVPPIQGIVPEVREADGQVGRAKIQADIAELPISFIVNAGQVDSNVEFMVKAGTHTIFFTPQQVVFAASEKTEDKDPQSSVVRLSFTGASGEPTIDATQPLPGVANFFLGNDSENWQTNVATYATITYHDLYPGIDLIYSGKQGRLKSEFVVAPDVDPTVILMDYNGASDMYVGEDGALVLETPIGKLVESPPLIYQVIDQQSVTIEGGYRLLANGKVAFALGEYITTELLIIDPTLIYSTYLGGNSTDEGRSIAVDGSGNAYITGFTYSYDFPTQNPPQPDYGGYYDAFVTKLNSTGSALIYSTYLGGSGWDEGRSIAVDTSGNAYVTGTTWSTNFPTQNPFQPDHAESYDAFVAKLNSTGSALIYSTYLGGGDTDNGSGIAVDSSGNAYVTGDTTSADFPTQNPLQPVIIMWRGRKSITYYGGGSTDAFVAKLNSTGSALIYSTHLGGTGYDNGSGIAVDSSGNAYITGCTYSTDFPTQNPLQPDYGGYPDRGSRDSEDAFVAKLNSTGSALIYATYLGGSSADEGRSIAVDGSGNAYVTGETESDDFPVKNALQPDRGSGDSEDAFVAKLNSTGSALIYSTYLGGGGTDNGSGIAVDSSGNAYVTGNTESTDFPTQNPLQPDHGGSYDAFVAKLNSTGSALIYATYLGGSSADEGRSIAVDGSGNAYITGCTYSTDFPTQNAYQPGSRGFVTKRDGDAFVTKLSPSSAPNQYPVANAGPDGTMTGEYVNPLNSDDCLEINRDGTCYMETLGLNMGTTGQWKLDNKRISLLFPYGETYSGTAETDAILLEEFGGAPVVWIKPTKSPPRLRDVAGRYVKEDHPDEYLALDTDGTYTKKEASIGSLEPSTISGEWDLDGHVVTLFYLGDRASGISVAVFGGCLYSTGLFGTDIWIGELREEPAPEEVAPAESSPEEEKETASSGKAPEVQWEKLFDAGDVDQGVEVQQTDDGGYIVLGTTDSTDTYDALLAWLIKTDALGNTEWEKTFPMACLYDGGYSVQQTTDGGYVLVGATPPTMEYQEEMLLIKLDSEGNEEWTKTFGGPDGYYYGHSVQQTVDGGYVIVGETDSYGQYGYVWLVKTDSFGNKEWDRGFGGDLRDWGLSVEQTDDLGYVIGGHSFRGSFEELEDYFWLIKTDRFGYKEWDRLYSRSTSYGRSTSIEYHGNVQQTNDGGYIVGVISKLPRMPYCVWLIKTGSSGDEEWDRTFEEVREKTPACFQQTDDGGYIIGTICITSGDYISGDIVTALWLLKTDSLGEEEWGTALGENTTGAFVQQTSDGGYIVVGTKLSSDSESDIWLVKLVGDEAPPRGEELDCKIELRKQDTSSLIDTIDVNESFDIRVEVLSGEPYQVRFSSDEDQNSVATGEWTDWYDWTTSSGDWDAAGKTMAWTFTTSGDKEVCVEIRDGNSSGTTCFANIDTSGTHDDATITQLEGLIDDLIEDYRNRLDEIKGYTLSNAESFTYFDNCVSKDEIDIKVDLGATLFSLALSGMVSTAEVIHYKHTAVLSVIEEIAWETRRPVAYALLESVGGIDNIFKALAELTKESLQIVAGEALKEISYQLTSNKSAFARKFIDHLGQQIDKDQEQLESLAREVKQELWSLTPEEAEQYVAELQALKSGNLFLFDNYSRKSILTKTIAEIRKIDEEDWKLKLADLLWGTSVGLLKVSAHLATGGFLLPATITAIDAAREQFFENGQKLSVDAQLRGLAVETLSEGFTIGGTIYNNTQQALKDIRDRNHLCIPRGSISVENKRIRRIFESGTANTTPMYLGEEEVSDVYVTKDEQCREETKYTLSVFYKAPYTSFKLFPGVEITYEDLLPVHKTSEVHDGSVRFQYDVSPEGSDLTFYLFGENEGRLYGLQRLSIKEWDPIEVVVKESRDYLGRFVSSAIEEQNYEALSVYYDNDTDKLIYRPTEVARIKSPGELRMYDSQGRVTGLVDGRIREEIPGAVYDDANKLVIAPSTTGYHYKIAGTEKGTYELEVISIDSGEATTFSAVNMPTAARTVHQYTIDWDALVRGEQGASLEVDSEGDGSFEISFSAQDEFDGNSVSPEKLANPKGGSLLWLWIILGVTAVTIITIAIMISMKRKSSRITLKGR